IGATADDASALRARSLLRRAGKLTQAAALLFAQNPQEWMPRAFVRVTRFSEDAPGTGSRQNMEAGGDERTAAGGRPLSIVVCRCSARRPRNRSTPSGATP